ncbi:hypothetical protein [Neomoorella humiferrea]|uniref:hypothetical protein n=1 Tax=Neomoorella humiferrea TaxID=676965 RepID=UPI0030D5073C
MLFLGHTGLTLAAARVIEKVMVPGGRQRPGGRPRPPGLIDYRLVQPTVASFPNQCYT